MIFDAIDFAELSQRHRPLQLRDRLFGRVELRGRPLTLVAAHATGLPRGTTHGVLAYRADHGGRDYINPTLVVRRGERVQVQFVNRLDEPTITHWHGLGVDTRNDGSGMNLIPPGQAYEYAFDVRDRGSLYWYHPHPHGTTGRQLYDGLFGMLELEDEDHRYAVVGDADRWGCPANRDL